MTSPRFHSKAVTHPGAKRKHNEDAYVDRPDLGVWAVADGAGGHAAGEVASGMIAEALEAIPPGLSASELLAEVRPRERAPADRPFVFVNMVSTIDGRAQVRGRTGELGEAADLEMLLELRAVADAVLVGTGTLRAEGYGRLVRSAERRATVERRDHVHEHVGRVCRGSSTGADRRQQLPRGPGRTVGAEALQAGRGAASHRCAAVRRVAPGDLMAASLATGPGGLRPGAKVDSGQRAGPPGGTSNPRPRRSPCLPALIPIETSPSSWCA